MNWSEVQRVYADRWLIIEALDAHTEGNQRLLDRIAVIETCPDATTAMERYRQLHQEFPLCEFYFVHTSREALNIKDRWWTGIRQFTMESRLRTA